MGGHPRQPSDADFAMLMSQQKVSTPKGQEVRIGRLAVDWSLLENPGTKAFVQKFAESQTEFHSAFSTAWRKVIDAGHNNLRPCLPCRRWCEAHMGNQGVEPTCLKAPLKGARIA